MTREDLINLLLMIMNGSNGDHDKLGIMRQVECSTG